MKCPKCGVELEPFRGGWFGTGLGWGSIKLQRYRCLNKDCKAFKNTFFKNIKSGEPVAFDEVSWTEKSIADLERWKGFV